MPKNNSKNGIHAQRLKAIRSFVSFDYDLRHKLTSYQKRKIKTYHDEILALTQRPYYVYRPRTKKHLKAAQEFAQHEKQLPQLKVALIPTDGKTKPKITFNKRGELISDTEHVRTRFIAFDPDELVANRDDIESYVTRVIENDHTSKSFTILAGRYEITNSYSKEVVGRWCAKYATKYDNPDNNNYFGNWMIGLNGHSYKRQSDFLDYKDDRDQARRKLKAERKRKRDKLRKRRDRKK